MQKAPTSHDLDKGKVPVEIFWVGGIVALAFLPALIGNEYYLYKLNIICINIMLAVGLNIVKGFTGQVTVGHVALYAIGAYSSALLSTQFGYPFWLSLPTAIAISALAGLLIGFPAIRLEGAYLALATLGFAETVRIVLLSTTALGGTAGIGAIPPPEFASYAFDTAAEYFHLVMPITVVGIYVSFALLRSKMGRAFMAVREDPLAAASVGVNVRNYKLLAFVISAVYAGCAGAFYAHLTPGYIHPNNFTIIEMVLLLLMVVIGGIGRIWGGVVGAIIVTLVHEWAREYYQYELIIFGLIIVLSVAYLPKGIFGAIRKFAAERRFREARKRKKNAAAN